MTTLRAVAAARAALLDLFDPLAAFFDGLHARFPHLVDTSSAYTQSFSFALDATGQAFVQQPEQGRGGTGSPPPVPFLDVARIVGMTGHTTTRLFRLAEDARQAIEAAAPHAGARGYKIPDHPLMGYATIFSEPPKYTRHQPPSIALHHGALQTTLSPRGHGVDEVSWKLSLLARLRSHGRSTPYLIGTADGKRDEVWADSVEDALLMAAVQAQDQEAAQRFLASPVVVWAHLRTITPTELLGGTGPLSLAMDASIG